MNADEHFDVAMSLLTQGKNVPAALEFEKVIAKNPRHAMAYNNRGNALMNVGHHFDAALNYQCAIALDPKRADYHHNYGAACAEMGRYEEALEFYDNALGINPRLDKALVNTGNLLRIQGQVLESEIPYRRAIEVAPDNADAHMGLALTLLELGHWEEGWVEYEWRWKTAQMPQRSVVFPEWDFHDGATVLVYGEQGLGDIIQFLRYVPKVAAIAKVHLEVPLSLQRLARTLKGVDQVIVYGEAPPPDTTHQVALLSLPRLFNTIPDTVPAEVPYLSAHPWRVKQWRHRLSMMSGLKVGLCWTGLYRPGNPMASAMDKRRSMSLSEFRMLPVLPGISWISLQFGSAASQARNAPAGMTIHDWTSEIEDFWDTAALVQNLDLVITVDTAVAHLAGALGKPVWLLSRFDGCWRWMGDRTNSPWYPTLRQFRQPVAGDWESVMKAVMAELPGCFTSYKRLEAVKA